MSEKIRSLKPALLVFHSPADKIVSIENAAQIYKTAKHPKSFVSLDTADHLLTSPGDARYVADVLSAWAGRFLASSLNDSEIDSPQHGVTVSETGQGKFTNQVAIREHRFLADEPVSVGGDDRGPGPYEYLLAGLGACTSMTLRMYAERKGIPLEKVSISLEHSRIHANDCDTRETKEGYLDRIDKTIELTGKLEDSQKTRMMEIADRCPVHRTLQSEIIIRSKLVE